MSLEFVKSVDGKWKYSLLEIKASKKDQKGLMDVQSHGVDFKLDAVDGVRVQEWDQG